MKPILIKQLTAVKDGKNVTLNFVLKPCPFKPDRFALEFNGDVDGRGYLLGMPRLTKRDVKAIAKKLYVESLKL